jgi:hypothetical protein
MLKFIRRWKLNGESRFALDHTAKAAGESAADGEAVGVGTTKLGETRSNAAIIFIACHSPAHPSISPQTSKHEVPITVYGRSGLFGHERLGAEEVHLHFRP